MYNYLSVRGTYILFQKSGITKSGYKLTDLQISAKTLCLRIVPTVWWMRGEPDT